MVVFARDMTKIVFILLINIMVVLGMASWTQADTIDGFGTLKLGMTPSEVVALDACSTRTMCLYEIFRKNRYVTLIYDANVLSHMMASSLLPTAKLTHIDIDMGAHTKEWFEKLYDSLVSQYALAHIPTKQEDTQFQDGTDDELIIGFAEGAILLKLVRRPFGNLILRVVYQNEAAAEAQRQYWEQITLQSPTR